MSESLLYAKRLLSLLAAVDKLSVKEEKVHFSEELQPWFQGEKIVSPPWNTTRAYFWQRLFRVVAETEPAFYRLGVPSRHWPPVLADFVPPVWLFWALAQYTAPRLMEEAIVFVVDEKQVRKVEPEFLMNSLFALEPVKLRISPEECALRVQQVRNAASDLLKSRIEQVKSEMEGILKTELERIHLYYESILKNRVLSEETRFLLQEREHLILEHHRRLAPENLRVMLRLELGAVLIPLST